MSQTPVHDLWWLHSPSHLIYDPVQQPTGLTQPEAARRLLQYGANTLEENRERPVILQFLSHFKNPLILILLAASLVSLAVGDYTNFSIIVCIVSVSVLLDFFQEYRANTIADKLRSTVTLRARVLRDGTENNIVIDALVPGDIIFLSAGDLAPADGIVIEAHDFFVNQALLTGEPYPVEKFTQIPDKSATDAQSASNAVFRGSSVLSGSATVVVIKTGKNSAIGDIAALVSHSHPPTPFEKSTRRFGMLIMRLTMLMVMAVLLVSAASGKPWLESFLFAVALAVGLTPELLPMIVSVTLAKGSVRMADKGMIVKRQTAIQDLGSMDVLCTDKTGTLTEAEIRLERHVDIFGKNDDAVLHYAFLNSFFESGLRNPIDKAILKQSPSDTTGWKKIDEVPFDFERRRVSVLLKNDNKRWLIVKGAPDDIMGLCTSHGSRPDIASLFLDEAAAQQATLTCHALEDEGFRVLGIAWKCVPPDHPHAVVDDESELHLAGFAAFYDPPKATAGSALMAIAQLGVEIKIVTGDSERVTRHLCNALDIPIKGVLTGQEILDLDEDTLRVRVTSCNLFCRTNPAAKSRVIQAIKAQGHVVGYLGDGVNDAPSLHAADIGLSVDSAVDVAKAAADMILLKKDLHVLRDAVIEGRRTFGNIMKYIMMGTSSNFGNMFSMVGAAYFLPFLPMMPTQILLNNMLYDLSEIAIPFDSVDEQDVAQPHVMDIHLIENFMWTIGPISSLFDFIAFYLLIKLSASHTGLFQTGWFIESLFTQILVIFVIRTRNYPWASKPHPLLTISSLVILMLSLALPYTPLAHKFGFVPLPPVFYALLVPLIITYLITVEICKQWFYSRRRITGN